jgi:hypothetical protein
MEPPMTTTFHSLAERAQDPAYVAALTSASQAAETSFQVSPSACDRGGSSIAENRAGAMGGSIRPGAPAFQYGVLIEQTPQDGSKPYIGFDDVAHDSKEGAIREAAALSHYSDIRLLALIRINVKTGATYTVFDEGDLTDAVDAYISENGGDE